MSPLNGCDSAKGKEKGSEIFSRGRHARPRTQARCCCVNIVMARKKGGASGVAVSDLLWFAARCQPGFAAAAAFIVSLTIVWTITFGIGHFGDPAVPIGDRIMGADAAIVGVALCAYVLAAVFAERRKHAGALEESEARVQDALTALQEALAAGEVIAFECDLRSGLARHSGNAAKILASIHSTPSPSPNSSGGFILTTGRASRRTRVVSASAVPPVRSPFVSFAPTARRSGSKKRPGRNLTRPAALYGSKV
jgi:hypothetical protein